MKRLILIVLLAVFLAACGAGESTIPTDEAGLTARLLSQQDMPPGWTGGDPDYFEGESTFWVALACGDDLPADSVASTSTMFMGGEFGPLLVQAIDVYQDSATATAVLTELKADLTECAESDYELMSFPDIGEESFALRAQPDDDNSLGRQAVILRGDNAVMTIFLTGVLSDATQIMTIARAAAERLAGE